MKNRRTFLKTSAANICAAPFLSLPFNADVLNGISLVKQPEDCETYFVRENTPITFNITKTSDRIPGVSLLTEELVPGSVIPTHKHLKEDEFFFFIQGTGTVTIDEKTFDFKPGTTAFIPKNTWHSLRNTGEGNAIFRFGFSPAGFEDFFREIGTPKGQPFKPKSKEEVDAISKKYGMVFK